MKKNVLEIFYVYYKLITIHIIKDSFSFLVISRFQHFNVEKKKKSFLSHISPIVSSKWHETLEWHFNHLQPQNQSNPIFPCSHFSADIATRTRTILITLNTGVKPPIGRCKKQPTSLDDDVCSESDENALLLSLLLRYTRLCVQLARLKTARPQQRAKSALPRDLRRA